MMTVEQATKALIAAIDAERQRLPRGASEAERKLLAQCANAVSLINGRRTLRLTLAHHDLPPTQDIKETEAK